ncbi:MAG: CDP-glucose 4,6-dehydratase [Flavobacteriales bacterium]|nr:CDP-glucose 4,6-dehydratase [Flavobacteriales bacterium]
MDLNSFWKGKRVFITGHTGFKGSWMTFWLNKLGAEVAGFALAPDKSPNLYDLLSLEDSCESYIEDIRDADSIKKRILDFKPDFIFHLAAQAIVLKSYEEPVMTWDTNVMGTVHLLEACKELNNPCSVVVITTDKVYENKEWYYAYRENDRLGGYDPYSSSKAAVELVVSSWRQSFFSSSPNIKLASARAGNVIGGGDWTDNRIIPDIFRHKQNGTTIPVRNPNGVRPWQHVLESLHGYLTLAELLHTQDNEQYQSAFNFGPDKNSIQSVEQLLNAAAKVTDIDWENTQKEGQLHEATLLTLSTEKASKLLKWNPKWDFETSIIKTIQWYDRFYAGENAKDLVAADIQAYTS